MKVRDAYEDYLWEITHLSPKARRGYKVKIEALVRWCEEQNPPVTLERLDTEALQIFFTELSTHTNPETQQWYARTIKAFLFWCSRDEYFEGILSESVPRRMEIPRPESRVLEVFTTDKINKLIKAAEREHSKELQARDKAILSVLIGTGMRASELLGLTLDQCSILPGYSHIRVDGERKKWRIIPLPEHAASLLQRYIRRYRTAAKDESHVFLSRTHKPMSVTGLEQLIARLGRWANIQGVRCSPHTFKNSYAVKSLLSGMNIHLLKLRMGHSSITITKGYLKTVENIVARKAEHLYI